MSNRTVFTDVKFTPAEQERFWPYVVEDHGCWVWSGALVGGYGTFGFRQSSTMAHRAAYMMTVGPIPEGLQLDHLCRNRACVNPDHLDPVTPSENQRRSAALLKTCALGHPWTEESTRFYDRPGTGTPHRFCVICNRVRAQKSMAKTRLSRGIAPRGRKTHCKRGHEFTPGNTHWRPDRPGQRECIACQGIRSGKG